MSKNLNPYQEKILEITRSMIGEAINQWAKENPRFDQLCKEEAIRQIAEQIRTIAKTKQQMSEKKIIVKNNTRQKLNVVMDKVNDAFIISIHECYTLPEKTFIFDITEEE